MLSGVFAVLGGLNRCLQAGLLAGIFCQLPQVASAAVSLPVQAIEADAPPAPPASDSMLPADPDGNSVAGWEKHLPPTHSILNPESQPAKVVSDDFKLFDTAAEEGDTESGLLTDLRIFVLGMMDATLFHLPLFPAYFFIGAMGLVYLFRSRARSSRGGRRAAAGRAPDMIMPAGVRRQLRPVPQRVARPDQEPAAPKQTPRKIQPRHAQPAKLPVRLNPDGTSRKPRRIRSRILKSPVLPFARD